jgi:hypothetical protein
VPRAALCSVIVLVVSICHQTMAQDSSSSSGSRRDINAVLAAHDKELLAIPGVVGIYVGTFEDRRTPCLKVMLAQDTPELRRAIPPMLEGYPVLVEVTGEIKALRKP